MIKNILGIAPKLEDDGSLTLHEIHLMKINRIS